MRGLTWPGNTDCQGCGLVALLFTLPLGFARSSCGAPRAVPSSSLLSLAAPRALAAKAA